MLHTRSLLPLVSASTPQWHLRALLRLPIELRQLVVRDFSSAAEAQVDDGDIQSPVPREGIVRRLPSGLAAAEDGKQSQTGMNRGVLRKTTYRDQTIPRQSHDVFEPFQEQADGLAGFGADTLTYRLPLKDRLEIPLEEGTSLRAMQSGSTTRRFQFRDTADSQSPSATAATIAVRKFKRSLDRWRTPEEVAEYDRLVAAYLAISPESRVNLGEEARLGMKALRMKARIQRDKEALGGEMDMAIREELQQTPQPEMIVGPNGSVATIQEEMERQRLDRLMPHPKTKYDPGLTSAELQRAREERSVLTRKAALRGQILRKKAGNTQAYGQSVSQRLALLKKTLVESPAEIANAPVIQEQLQQLERDLKRSMKSTLPTDYDAKTSASFNASKPVRTKSERVGRRATLDLDKTMVDEAQEKLIQSGHQRQEPALPTSTKSTDEVATQDVVAQPGHVSMFADLRAQIQELTSVMKVLVSQQAASQASSTTTQAISQVIDNANNVVSAAANAQANTAEMSDGSLLGRYDAMARSPSQPAGSVDDFAALPHELGEENKTKTRTISKDEQQRVQASTPTSDPQPPTIPVDTADSTTNLNNEASSLYEQLFPEEAARVSPRRSLQTPVPRLSLPQDQDQNPQASTRDNKNGDFDDQRPKRTVLVLRSASKTLTEDDFRRALPRGKHIQEWTKRGEYSRVIPMRDFWTLERTGDYFIVFKHWQIADAFMAHVKRLHELSRSHTPSTFSLMAELPPAPKGLLKDGYEDEAALVQNFTLVAPSMSLQLERLSKGVKAEVLAKGAYPQALAGNLTPETPQVLLEMDGGIMPNWFQIRDAVARDGMKRGLPWNLVPGDLGLRRLTMKPTPNRNQAPTEDGTANELADVDKENDLGSNYNTETTQAQDRLQNGANGQRWIIAFGEREEAQRFARGWHMRRFPWAEPEMKRDRVYKGSTRCKAEVLW